MRIRTTLISVVILAGLVLTGIYAPAAHGEDIRIGMIGLDTSHVIAFTGLLNNPGHKDHVPGGKIVAAFKGGSDDIESSYTRVDEYTQQLQDRFGVKIVDTIEELCALVDAIMIESVDGRPHLEQAKPVFKAGLPVFIDKPLAGSLSDAIEIARLAREHNVPWFSSSSYRYYDSFVELKNKDLGEIRGAISYGPCHLEPHHPDLFWYGVHPTEALFAIMGTGCQTVVRTTAPELDVVTGTWEGGRLGILYGLRTPKSSHKVIAFGAKGIGEQVGGGDYAPLVRQVITFFQTRVPPIPPEETIELFAFMEAADESKRRGGVPVSIREVMALAQEANAPAK